MVATVAALNAFGRIRVGTPVLFVAYRREGASARSHGGSCVYGPKEKATGFPSKPTIPRLQTPAPFPTWVRTFRTGLATLGNVAAK